VLTLSLVAAAKLGREGDARVAFTAVGPGGLKFEGVSSDLRVAEEGSDVTVVVPLAGFKTGIDLRDRHMREKYLQVAQFPEAKLVVPRSSLKFPAGGAPVSAEGHGTLTLHGQTKPVTFQYTAKPSAPTKYEVEAKTRVNVKEYGIEVPSYLGVTVKPDIDVAVKFVATDG
jgi:polyisoprenoid-binding protein YceI